jgi:HK97 family phage portal protein
MGILARVEKRASIENPSTSLSNPAAWLVEALGGGSTNTGLNVNQQTALKLSAVWACVNVLSQDVAKLPLITYRRVAPRGKVRAVEHPLFRVLRLKANPQMSAYNFRRTLEAHVVTWGNAFAEIERNNNDDVIALWPLLPDRTSAKREGGRKIIVTRINGEDIPLRAEDVLHIPGLGFDGLRGYSVITHAREAIALGQATEMYGGSFFGNGARPGGAIMHPQHLTETAQDNLRRSFTSVHQGLSNAQRVAILDEGMDYKPIGIPPEDAQFLQTQQWSVEQVIRFFRVPPHKVHHLLHAGVRANVESENISYTTDTLMPWLVNWEQEINTTLLSEEEQVEFFAEHEVKGLLRGDADARSKFYQSGIMHGWLSPNDARELENLNPVEGGDQYFIPLNLIPLDGDGQMSLGLPGDSTDGDEENSADRIKRQREQRSAIERHRIQELHKRGFRAAAQRVIERENSALRRIITKAYEDQRDATTLESEMANFYQTFVQTVARDYQPVVQTLAAEVKSVIGNELGIAQEPDPQYDTFVDEFNAGMARRHVQKSQDQLLAITREVPIEEQEAALNERLDEWDERRAAKIADSETVRANGAFSKTAYILAGIFSLVWRQVGTSCPFCRKLDGKVVGVRENFMNTGDILDSGVEGKDPMKIRRGFGHPPAHEGCDCVVGPGL